MHFTKQKATIALSIVIIICIGALFMRQIEIPFASTTYNGADIAWMLTATALVLLMTPGLAFFYGGMVNKKNVLSTMLQSFIAMAVITIVWIVLGFSCSFGNSLFGIYGNPFTYFMGKGLLSGKPMDAAPTIPLLLFALYQLKFAIITPALITGAVAGRIRFTGYIIFLILFCLFIYCPLAHATWHPNGILAKLGVLDFAGGTVVHMSAGWAALAAALFLKQKNEEPLKHARITYVLLGTGLLWFGWFGFNAGSAFGANALATTALATTTIASASAAFTWILCDTLRGRKPGAMGTCIGAVVGLVAITPAAGYISLPHSLIIGVVSSFVSNWLVQVRTRTGIDDTLDVFPCHGVGGMVGMMLTAVFAHKNINASVVNNGLLFGETKLFFAHCIALVGVSVFAFFGTYIIIRITNFISPLGVKAEEEIIGLDVTQHGESL